MTKDEAIALKDYAKQLSDLLEVPIDIFSELTKWADGRVLIESPYDNDSFWKQIPKLTIVKTGKFKLEIDINLQGKLINGITLGVTKILTEREYEYSVKNGNNCEFVKGMLKDELIQDVVKNYLDFTII